MSDAETLLIQTKQAVNGIVDLLYTTAKQNGLADDRDTFVIEFEAIATYLAGIDAKVADTEIFMMNYIFDLGLSESDMPKLLQLVDGMYKPLIVDLQMPGWQIAKALDKVNNFQTITDMYISALEIMLMLFAASDGNMDASELQFMQDLISRLKADR